MLIAGVLLSFAVSLYVSAAACGMISRVLHQRRVDRLAEDLLRTQFQNALLDKTQKEQAGKHWNGVRKFVVARKTPETYDTVSLYLRSHDGKPLPIFLAGQFLTFRFHIPGEPRPVVRCYSLSNNPNENEYRITVRRVPTGTASNFVHDKVSEGDILDVLAPRGDFCLQPGHFRPTVLIGGGVGITPLLSMLECIAASDNSPETWLIYGVRSAQDLIQTEYLKQVVRENSNLRFRYGYSAANDDASEASFQGRVTVDYLKHVLASNNYEFYICGPPAMMKSLVADLREWGVPASSIHTEAFGADSVKVVSSAISEPPSEPATPQADAVAVTFARSSVVRSWDSQADNLLVLAETANIKIDAGCRAGSCGSCETAIRAGSVRYLEAPGFECSAGSCLPCVCVPAEQLELDA